MAGIPEPFLPLHGLETQSCYRCQFPDCTQIFLQKAAACTHICHNHLNVALHIHKHSEDGLPIFPYDPAFTQLFPEALPSTSVSTPESFPLNIILERAKAVRLCLEEEIKTSTSSKRCIKQGPIKKSRKQKDE